MKNGSSLGRSHIYCPNKPSLDLFSRPGDKGMSWQEFFLAKNRRVYLYFAAYLSAPTGGDNSWMTGKSN